MCGIAGIWGEADQPLVQRLIEQMIHRGPDGSGMHLQSQQGVLGHRRLAIMDPIGGMQPIYNESRSASIVANGEIYNFPALRSLLSQRHHFATTSDSEAILHLFEEQNSDLFSQLEGMFAFAIQDQDRLFLARDPIGIKPLYYGTKLRQDGHSLFYFASEMKVLADAVDEIHEFPQGHFWDSQQGFVQYYAVPTAAPVERPLAEQIRIVRQSLEDAVASHLMSDVPVGAFLSGGLDSSVIAAMARKHVRQLHTFAVGVEGSNDLLAARRVAKHIDSIHHEYLFTPAEVVAKLPEIIHSLESFDQDLVRSAIPCYFCSRMAADYVKVILTGEGADELFAGYKYHKEIRDPEVLHKELCRTVTTLHNINLQRVDRLTMLHSIEGRVPFLDTKFIETALSIPAEHKIVTMPNGQRMEKWILRKACEDLLPPEIVWRTKEQFDEGSGTVDLLRDALGSLTGKLNPSTYRASVKEYLRSDEEALYHKLLVDSYSHPQVILPNVARWVANRYL